MKCIAVLPCEKIIVDKAGAHSIINVMLQAEIGVKSVDPSKTLDDFPKDAIAPNQWWIYTLWTPASQDVGKEFEQVYHVYWPNGDKVVEGRLSFTQKDSSSQQTSYSIVGLPVGQVGDLSIKTYLDSHGHCVTDVIETRVRIRHSQFEAPAPVPANFSTL
jgi:hypothetical protein